MPPQPLGYVKRARTVPFLQRGSASFGPCIQGSWSTTSQFSNRIPPRQLAEVLVLSRSPTSLLQSRHGIVCQTQQHNCAPFSTFTLFSGNTEQNAKHSPFCSPFAWPAFARPWDHPGPSILGLHTLCNANRPKSSRVSFNLLFCAGFCCLSAHRARFVSAAR